MVALLIIFNYKSLMYDTVGFFSKVKSFYVQGDFQARRILEIFAPENQEIFGEVATTPKNAEIKVKNLDFSFGNQTILKNVNFEIMPHSAAVLLGASGSGKTTLFYLLSRILDAAPNTIFFNNTDILNFSKNALRETLCVVNQEQFIFNDTVLNNLKIACPNATKESIENACKMANIHQEILNMENGYNTLLTENGGNLSGGQKQRLAIARAILKNTPILLFDEPTSALDKENQQKFFEIIAKLKEQKTIFVIAHKITNAEISQTFDSVFELNNGILSKK